MIKDTWFTQKQVCDELGIDPKTFRKWDCVHVYEKANKKYYRLKDIVHAHHQQQINKNIIIAPGEQETIDKDYEEALKIREERIGKQLKNALALKTQAPIEILEQALSSVNGAVDARLTSIPLNIKRNHPTLPAIVIRDIEKEIVKAQNLIADSELDWSLIEEMS